MFALRDIDMTKVEVRPMRSNPILTAEKDSIDGSVPAGPHSFNYLFYVDFVGTLAEPRCQNALRHLQVRWVVWGWVPAGGEVPGVRSERCALLVFLEGVLCVQTEPRSGNYGCNGCFGAGQGQTLRFSCDLSRSAALPSSFELAC